MKVQVIEAREDVLKKTGELRRSVTVLGDFANYGTIKKSTVEIRLDDENQYNYFKAQEGKDLDIDVVIPLPDFPLTIAKMPKSYTSSVS